MMYGFARLAALVLFSICISAQARAAAACAPEGGAEYICGLPDPEDLIQVPGSPWVIVSSMSPTASKIYAVDSRTRKSLSLFPASAVSADASAKSQSKPFPGCPAPLPPGVFGAHGIDLRRRSADTFTLYVVNHAGRESIEILNLTVSSGMPSATWVGCVVFPAHASGNAVVGLPGGGFVATNFKDPADADAFKKMSLNQVTGNVLEWQAASGWTVIPDSDMSGANGAAVSPDGKWLYIANWPGKSVIRFERKAKSWSKRDVIATGLLTDNVHWLPDGSLVASGQDANMPAVFDCKLPQCRVASGAVSIDTHTLRTTRIVGFPGTGSFDGATTVIRVGNEYWLGSFRGDGLAILPAK